MNNKLVATSSITIHAPVSEVWRALITPELIKEYMFGTEAISDWKEGSEIRYKGVWEGKSYEDKGEILKLIPEKLFVSTYWSSLSGTEDKPENYATVTYELEPQGEKTKVTVSQDNILDQKMRDHSEQNWQMILGTLQKLLEK